MKNIIVTFLIIFALLVLYTLENNNKFNSVSNKVNAQENFDTQTEQEFSKRLKHALSSVNQALVLHSALTGEIAGDYTSASDFVNGVLKKRMRVIEQSEAEKKGWKVNEFSNPHFCFDTNATFVTYEGIMFCIKDYSSAYSEAQGSTCDSQNTTPCVIGAVNGEVNKPNLYIDVNGPDGPNMLTTNPTHPKDIYQAVIYSSKIVPFGKTTQEIMSKAKSYYR